MFVTEMFLNTPKEPVKEEAPKKKVLVVYPGRFQPWHKGHQSVYNHLNKEFGYGNVFISTSNKVEPPRSPFSFEDKLKMMKLTGVNPKFVVQSSQPYRSLELVENYDPTSTILLMAVSEKDMQEDPRFQFKPKKDGSPSYFQPYDDMKVCETLDKHAYMITVPTFEFSILGVPVTSATEIRGKFATANIAVRKKMVEELFGKFNDEVYKIMVEKLTTKVPVPESIVTEVGVESDKNYYEAAPYKNYRIYVGRKKFKNLYFIAATKIGNKDIAEKGNTQPEAVANLQKKIDAILTANMATNSAIIDFNSKFVAEVFPDMGGAVQFFAKIQNIGGQPKLVIAGDAFQDEPQELLRLGFKRAFTRIQSGGIRGPATSFPSIQLSAKEVQESGLQAHGRYEISNETRDNMGDRVFDLVFHSSSAEMGDKQRLNVPALTVGTKRLTGEGSTMLKDDAVENTQEGTPDTSQLLFYLREAWENISRSDAYGPNGKRTISSIFDLMRSALMKGDFNEFEQAWDFSSARHPDAFDVLAEEMFEVAGLNPDGTYDDLIRKVSTIDEAKNLLGLTPEELKQRKAGFKDAIAGKPEASKEAHYHIGYLDGRQRLAFKSIHKSLFGEAKEHISPDGVKTNMDPSDDDYQINYGPGGLVAKSREEQGKDIKTGTKKVIEDEVSSADAELEKVNAEIRDIEEKLADAKEELNTLTGEEGNEITEEFNNESAQIKQFTLRLKNAMLSKAPASPELNVKFRKKVDDIVRNLLASKSLEDFQGRTVEAQKLILDPFGSLQESTKLAEKKVDKKFKKELKKSWKERFKKEQEKKKSEKKDAPEKDKKESEKLVKEMWDHARDGNYQIVAEYVIKLQPYVNYPSLADSILVNVHDAIKCADRNRDDLFEIRDAN